jgi:hypothetical protein
MADKDSKGIKEASSDVPAGVQSITTSLPAASPASKEVGPSAPDTEHEAPPLHTARPDVPIAQVLASGSGEHTPPDPKEFDAEGRVKEVDAG